MATPSLSHNLTVLAPPNTTEFSELMTVFALAHEDASYTSSPLSLQEAQMFLSNPDHIVLVTKDATGQVCGGLVAYVLTKFEQRRKELFIYDIGVHPHFQRQGRGAALMKEALFLAKQRGCFQVFVEADGADEEAIAFYRSLMAKEMVTHQFTFSDECLT